MHWRQHMTPGQQHESTCEKAVCERSDLTLKCRNLHSLRTSFPFPVPRNCSQRALTTLRRQHRYQNNKRLKKKSLTKACSFLHCTHSVPPLAFDADTNSLPSINPSQEISHAHNVTLALNTSCALALDSSQQVGQCFLDLIFIHTGA
jgi:hypothetical protein